jgi:hypothetical protein
VPEVTPDPQVLEAERMRAEAFERCAKEAWQDCLDGFDAAKELDPEGDQATEVQRARERAAGALEEQRREKDDIESKSKLPTTPTSTVKSVAPPAPVLKGNKLSEPPLPTKKSLPNVKPMPQKKLPTKAPPSKPTPQQGSFDDPKSGSEWLPQQMPTKKK